MGRESDKRTVGTVFDDWLAVSTEGFASMNAGRPPAHLVKELVQNSLDAIADREGRIDLSFRPGPAGDSIVVICRDNGCGMANRSGIAPPPQHVDRRPALSVSISVNMGSLQKMVRSDAARSTKCFSFAPIARRSNRSHRGLVSGSRSAATKPGR